MTERPQGLIPSSGRKGRPRVLEQMMSARFPAPLLAEARAAAAEDGIKFSDWIRNAAASELLRRNQPAADLGLRLTGYQCPHLLITGTPSIHTAECMLGCTMQPVYAAA
jgi:hypothetical protein